MEYCRILAVCGITLAVLIEAVKEVDVILRHNVEECHGSLILPVEYEAYNFMVNFMPLT